ncbi:MAG: hypothetical protein ACI4SO_05130 [Muribaculaceae bacterium]
MTEDNRIAPDDHIVKRQKLRPDKAPPMTPELTRWQQMTHYVIKPPSRREYDYASLCKKFEEYVDFYSTHKISFTQKSRQRRSKKTGDEIQAERVERLAPMTEVSFNLFVGMSKGWLSGTIRRMEERTDLNNTETEYLGLLQRIKAFLMSQVIEGALLGEYSPVVAGALFSLRQSTDITSGGRALGAPVINLVAETRTREEIHDADAEEITDAEEAKEVSDGEA